MIVHTLPTFWQPAITMPVISSGIAHISQFVFFVFSSDIAGNQTKNLMKLLHCGNVTFRNLVSEKEDSSLLNMTAPPCF